MQGVGLMICSLCNNTIYRGDHTLGGMHDGCERQWREQQKDKLITEWEHEANVIMEKILYDYDNTDREEERAETLRRCARALRERV